MENAYMFIIQVDLCMAMLTQVVSSFILSKWACFSLFQKNKKKQKTKIDVSTPFEISVPIINTNES